MKTMTARHEYQDGLAGFGAVTVIKTMTSLSYHPYRGRTVDRLPSELGR